MTIFSERLKNARSEKGLTQQDLAKKLNISTSVIGDIESGRRVASKKTAAKLADFFNTTVEYWFSETAAIEYFSKREKYAALDNVVTTLLEQNKLKDVKKIPEDIWNMLNEALAIDLKVLSMKNNDK
ncbi:helix-turn-helix domain-containing protein [Clostridium sporogenes]